MNRHELSINLLSMYLMLVFSLFLVSLQLFEMFNIINTFIETISSSKLLESFMYEISTRLVFALFSLCSGLSSLILIAFLIVDLDLFIEKILTSYLYFNNLVFGPYLFGFCCIGFYFRENVFYLKDSTGESSISYTNIISIFFATVISLIIIFSTSLYHAFSNQLKIYSEKDQLEEHNQFLLKAILKVSVKKNFYKDFHSDYMIFN